MFPGTGKYLTVEEGREQVAGDEVGQPGGQVTLGALKAG